MKFIKKAFEKLNDLEKAIIFALIHSGLSFFYSRWFIQSNPDNVLEKRNSLLVSILLTITLTFVYLGVIKLVRERKKYSPFIKRGIIYFIVLMIFLFLVWPGVWRHDDMTLAFYNQNYVIDGWQHALTSLLYMMSFRLIPIYSGVIIVQCAIIAVITSYLYGEVLARLKVEKTLFKIILWIPFLLPPIIDNALYPLRPILFSYVLILSIYLMIKFLEQKSLSWKKIALLSFLFIIGASWRSEGIYVLLVAVFYLVYLAKKNKINFKVAGFSLIAIFSGFFIIRSFQSSISSSRDQMRYQLSGTVEILAPLVREASNYPENSELLEIVDKVISVEMIIDNPTVPGEYIFWTEGAVRQDFAKEDYNNYLKSLIRLAVKYPKVVIKNRILEFEISSALKPNQSNTIRDTSSYYQYPEDGTAETFIARGGRLMHPWNAELRAIIIRILEGRTLRDYYKTTVLYPVFWNLVIPFISILIFILRKLKKKKYSTAIIVCSILVKSAIVFATAPGTYHMYYYAEFLLGYILLAYMIVELVNSRVLKRHKTIVRIK